jgi:hypothetical protein
MIDNAPLKRDSLYRCNINFFVSCLPHFEKSSYTKYALAYQINWKMYTPDAGESGMLLHRKGKLTIAKSKSSRLSYSRQGRHTPLRHLIPPLRGPGVLVNPFIYLTCNSYLCFETDYSLVYEADLSDSVVSFILSSLGYIKWT